MIIIGIIGTGGFSREVAPIAKQMLQKSHDPKDFKIVFVSNTLDDINNKINGYDVILESDFIKLEEGVKKYFSVAIADSKLRQKIVENLLSYNIAPMSLISDTTTILDECKISEGAILCAQSIITSNVKIGKYFHSNLNSYVAHDCVIGDYVTFAPSVHCNGNIIINDHAYIGTGAIIKQGTTDKPLIIGEGAIVGMGAVVTKDVAPNTIVIGNPAKPM